MKTMKEWKLMDDAITQEQREKLSIQRFKGLQDLRANALLKTQRL